MKVKIRQLDGLALCWAAAKANGYQVHKDEMLAGRTMDGWWLSYPGNPNNWMKLEFFRVDTQWSLGGPLTQKHQINLQYCTDLRDNNRKYVWADMGTHAADGFSDGHDQPLLAAMRCLVEFHAYGQEEIDVPEELLS